MKRFTFVSLLLVSAFLLSSCSLGVSKLLHLSSGPSTPKAKVIKATHTPPSAPTKTASTPTVASTPAIINMNVIAITNGAFQPGTLEVTVGTTVIWTNNDIAPHTVTSDTVGLFDSGPLNPGGTFTYTFTQAGTFSYHSTNETTMVGTIKVK